MVPDPRPFARFKGGFSASKISWTTPKTESFDAVVADPYREFEEALTDVLTETAYNLSRRTRLANARAAVDQNDHRYIEAVNRAFLMTLNQGPRQMG
jgi:hypothetical protein